MALWGDTYGAGADGSATCGTSSDSPDVWYRLVGACDGLVTISTEAAYDTVLSVHTGCPGTTANQVACNDDIDTATDRNSLVTFATEEGAEYLIRVSGFNGAAGIFILNIADCAVTPPAGCPGDENEDGAVDFTDLNRVLGNFGTTSAPGSPGDENEDGTVDFLDLNRVLGNFGSEC